MAKTPSPTAPPLPRISLVTPSFNQAEFLEAALRSVVDQEYPDLEYVVVDGGSTDGSLEIIRRYEAQLTSWVSETDRGHGHAINKGFASASGEIMGWLNSDDFLLPGSLEQVGRLFQLYPQMDWLTSCGALAEPRGGLVRAWPSNRWTRSRFLSLSDAYIQQESTFWRRELWGRAGGYVSENYLSCDFELWARFFRHARLDQTLGLIGVFRLQAEQRSRRQNKRYLKEMQEIVRRELAARELWTLSDEEAEVYSEIRFDPAKLRFERAQTKDLITDELHRSHVALEVSERDRAARLKVIEDQQRALDTLARELAARDQAVLDLERDRAARLEVIQNQQREAETLGSELAARNQTVLDLERDRAARLEVIQNQQRELEALTSEIAALEHALEASQRDGAARLAMIDDLERALERVAAEDAAWLRVLPGLRARVPGGRERADRLRRWLKRFRRPR